jgi:hypothetical protein
MELSEIDITETQVLRQATNLVQLVEAYNEYVEWLNRNPDHFTQNFVTSYEPMRQLLGQIRELTGWAMETMQPADQVIEALGMPSDLGWSYELGQVYNACNTLDEELRQVLEEVPV